VNLVRATAAEAPALAAAHAAAFEAPWRQDEFEDLLEGERIFGFLAMGDDPLGMILCRVAAGEMEVLTLAVAPQVRRHGVAKALMTAALGAARHMGVTEVFLEVAVDNAAAAALYDRLGFSRTGLRRGYYDRGEAGLADALVMRLDLTSAAP
jgi:ribosomal-protein-alanine N-acetyltransferase